MEAAGFDDEYSDYHINPLSSNSSVTKNDVRVNAWVMAPDCRIFAANHIRKKRFSECCRLPNRHFIEFRLVSKVKRIMNVSVNPIYS